LIVVALAGHVDHGKTALVRALTGIDTDRLPEEKARGMTTDLGFAALDLPPGDGASGSTRPARRVGLVDVPGHERYIRNMAAGAWGADLCFLCTAADDGWMDQTENHCRLLSAFGLPRAIVIVTKIDLVERKRAQEVGADARRRAAIILGEAAIAEGFIATSALTGEGLAETMELAARECDAILTARASAGRASAGRASAERAAPERAGAGAGAWLFVDRVFSKKGAGLVVCGTLRGGAVRVEDELVLRPAGETLRVKGAESLGAAVGQAEPGGRVAFNTTKPKVEIRRGDLLCAPGAATLQASEFIVRVEETGRSIERREKADRALTKGGEAELVAGSARRTVRLEPFGKGGFFRLICDEKLAVPRGIRAALVRSGGAELLGAVTFVHAGDCGKAGRKRARETAAAVATAVAAADAGAAAAVATGVAADGRFAALAVATAIDGATPLDREALGYLPDPEALEECGFIVIVGHLVDKRAAKPTRPAGGPGTMNPKTNGNGNRKQGDATFRLPQPVALALAEKAAAATKIRVPERTGPSPAALDAERALRAAGIAGIEPNAAPERGKPPPPQRKLLEELCSAKLAVPLDRDLFWHTETYDRAAASVLSGLEPGGRLTIADAKQRAGLSRKYAIPFLNRLERDGWVKRDGETRVVQKRWTADGGDE